MNDEGTRILRRGRVPLARSHMKPQEERRKGGSQFGGAVNDREGTGEVEQRRR